LWRLDAAAGARVIVRALNDELSDTGFPTDRRAFQPHVASPPLQTASVELAAPIAWRSRERRLNVSESLRGGVRYRALAEWPLEGRGPIASFG
jgi:2'-5' RNA ligase